MQTLNTLAVPELTNQYFTAGRAVSAMAGLYEVPLTFSVPLVRTTNTISINLWGSGSKAVAANALGVSGNCANWTAAGLGDTGSPCGAGGGGANSNGFYLVTQTTNSPANAINLGALSTGLPKLTVSAGVATVSIAAAGTDYQAALGFTPENSANKGIASGYASLDGSIKIPIAQVPTGTSSSTVSLGNHTHSGVYEPVITGGTSAQYLKGDKSLGTFAHAATHATGGGDAITILASQVTGLAASATTDTTHAMSGTFSINLLAAVAGDSGSIVLEESKAIHLTRIACNVLGGTNAIINFDKRAEATPDTDTGHHLISDLTCTTGALVTTTTFVNGSAQCGGTSSCAVASRTPIILTITSVSGTNTALRVFAEYTID